MGFSNERTFTVTVLRNGSLIESRVISGANLQFMDIVEWLAARDIWNISRVPTNWLGATYNRDAIMQVVDRISNMEREVIYITEEKYRVTRDE